VDIVKLIKKQSQKQIAELHELTGMLSVRLKDLINLIPEKTRGKSVEAFLNDIRKGVFGAEGEKTKTPRKRRRRRASSKKSIKKVGTPKPGRKAWKKTNAPQAGTGAE
jgi:hypothetical protein